MGGKIFCKKAWALFTSQKNAFFFQKTFQWLHQRLSPGLKNHLIQEHLKGFPCFLWYQPEKQETPSVKLCKNFPLTSRQINSLFDSVQETGKIEHFHVHKTLKGKRYFFDLWGRPDVSQGIWGLALDVSPYKEKQIEGEQKIISLEKALDFFSQGVMIYGENKVLQYFNKSFLDLFPLNEAWLSKSPTLEEVFEELRHNRLLPEVVDFTAYKKKFLTLFEEKFSPLEEILHLPDERTLHLSIRAHCSQGLLFLFEDLTQKLVLERKHNTLVALQNALANHLQEGVLMLSVDHRVILMNASYRNLWGLEGVKESESLHHMLQQAKDYLCNEEHCSFYKETVLQGINHRTPKSGIIRHKSGLSLKFKYIPLPNGDHLLTYQNVTDTLKLCDVPDRQSFECTESV